MKKTILFLLFALVQLSYSQWEPCNNGFIAEKINTLAYNGTEIFLGTDYGIFLSTNNGDNWINRGLSGINIQIIVFDGSNIFAGTYDRGIYLSTDKGIYWIHKINWELDTIVYSIAIKDKHIFAATNGGLFHSTDYGNTWHVTNNDIAYIQYSSVLISGNEIFAATAFDGVYYSTDNGDSWKRTNDTLPKNCIHTMALKDSKIFVGTFFGGVFLSTNNGDKWVEKDSEIHKPMEDTYNTKVEKNNTNCYLTSKITAYAISLDGQDTTEIFFDFKHADICSFVITNNNIFAGTGFGLYLSYDNGDNWQFRSRGLTNLYVTSLCANSEYIFAGTKNGKVFKAKLKDFNISNN